MNWDWYKRFFFPNATLFWENEKFVSSLSKIFLVLRFHYELDKLKKMLSKNAYPQTFTDKCILKFFKNLFIWKPQISTVPIKELIIILLYLSKTSQIVKPYIGWASSFLLTDSGQNPFPKICYTYTTMMKLFTLQFYLTKKRSKKI